MRLTIYHYKQCIWPLDMRKLNARKKWWWLRKNSMHRVNYAQFGVVFEMIEFLYSFKSDCNANAMLCSSKSNKIMRLNSKLSMRKQFHCYINHFIALILPMPNGNLSLNYLSCGSVFSSCVSRTPTYQFN